MAQIKPNINSSSKLELIIAVENLRYQLRQYETLLGVKPFIKEDLKGADFTFEMFTLEQLKSLKLKFKDLSKQDKEELKGEDFIYEMFTPEQLENLKFRYEDFTQENLDYFRQPALDAAQVVQVAKENAETAASLANEKAELANQATIRANTATNKADISALNADEKARLAVTATQNANDVKTDYETVVKPDMIAKANYAEEQGDYAKEKGDEALIAKELTEQATIDTRNIAIFAGDKADEANQAAILANNKAGLADTATIAASEAVNAANTAAQEANTATGLANTAAEYANAQGDYAKGIGETVDSAETIRIDAENIRLQNEIDRINVEALRDSSETSRISAEVLREQAKADTIEATENANTATGLTIAAKDDYYNVVKPEIISQGEYATEQGDYAKQQGEAVEGAITDLQTNSEVKSNKTSDIEANKTSTDKYPSAKAVAEYVADNILDIPENLVTTNTEQDIVGLKTFVRHYEVMKFNSPNNRPQFIEFLKDGTRKAAFGSLSGYDYNRIGVQGANNANFEIGGFNTIKFKSKIQEASFGNLLKGAVGVQQFRIAPDNNTNKTLLFNNPDTSTGGGTNSYFNLDLNDKTKIQNVPIPNDLGDVANKAYVDTKDNLKENLSNKTSNIEADKLSEDKYPSAKAVSEYVADNSGGGTPQIIDLLPGQYLSDVIQSITDATIDKQYTINFYNYSKTINWETFTAKIHIPRFIHINFVGNIDWWANVYYPQMGFAEGLTDVNPVDKLFIGFSFDKTNDDDVTHISGLPTNLWKIFFGGLDSSWNEASEYQDLIDDPDDWGIGTLGLVRVNGSKEDDSRNDALYKKINDVFIDVTPEFMYCDFSGCNLNNAYFYSANNQKASFASANNQNAYFDYADNQGAYFMYANNQGAYFMYANNQGAYFYSANNQGAYFMYANNQGAHFMHTNNQNAYFYSTNNQGAHFDYADNQGANFEYADNQGAHFNSSNNQGATFDYANLKYVNWRNVISIQNANFQNADLTGGINLPERINTKAKWIAECGVGNVNAETIWIDGTSILS